MSETNNLQEMNFSDPDFFGPDFTQKAQAHGQAKLDRVGGRPNPGQMMSSLQSIIAKERPHKRQLEQLAVETAKRMFPVIDIANIQIEAQIMPFGQIPLNTQKNSRPIQPNDPNYKKAAKKKIMNAITQAAGVSMNTAHHAVDELDAIDPQLKNLYDTVYKHNDAIYQAFDKNRLIQMYAKQGQDGNAGGTSQVVFRNRQPFILAKAVSFVYLVHEIVKGVYEYLSLNAFDDEEEYKQVGQHTDSISDEIEDITTGEIIRDGIRNFLIDNHDDLYQHEAFFEMFLVELARTSEDEMVRIVAGILGGYPNRRRIEQLAKDAARTLRNL